MSWIGLWIVLSVNQTSFAQDVEETMCPDPGLKETVEDCPWGQITRSLKETIKTGGSLRTTFDYLAPELRFRIDEDQKHPEWKALWGTSINYDELAKGTIVGDEILKLLTDLFAVPAPQGRLVHAGAEHTYGYLFSDLQTPFGYKRARWVKPDIENGFGLARGALGPLPTHGTLFGNVTYFFGRIAFWDQPAILRTLESAQPPAPQDLTNYPFKGLEVKKIEERAGDIELNTFLVRFPNPPKQAGNSWLLIYTAKAQGDLSPKLISGFPVEDGFINQVTQPSNFGDNVTIVSRYNAFVKDLTDAKQPVIGKKSLIQYVIP